MYAIYIDHVQIKAFHCHNAPINVKPYPQVQGG